MTILGNTTPIGTVQLTARTGGNFLQRQQLITTPPAQPPEPSAYRWRTTLAATNSDQTRASAPHPSPHSRSGPCRSASACDRCTRAPTSATCPMCFHSMAGRLPRASGTMRQLRSRSCALPDANDVVVSSLIGGLSEDRPPILQCRELPPVKHGSVCHTGAPI